MTTIRRAIEALLRAPRRAKWVPAASRAAIAATRGVRDGPDQLAAVPTSPSSSASWLCWPSSDGAQFGWGDPYEDPPGTLVNPPLGTVQTSYDDVSHIAREISEADAVVHGVNKVAMPRDWRHDTTPLVVSWSETAIYSGGAEIKTGTKVLAACVRWTSGTPYLLWMEASPLGSDAQIRAQQCTVVDDAVTGVVGGESYCEIAGLTWWPFWCEFSVDGNSLIANSGADVTTHYSDELSVPATFGGQAVAKTRRAEAAAESKTWVSQSNYVASRKFLVKSQYIDGSLSHVWATITIRRESSNSITYTMQVPYIWPDHYTFCAECGGGVPQGSEGGGEWRLRESVALHYVDIAVEQDSAPVYSDRLSNYRAEGWTWESTIGGTGTIAPPDASPIPTPSHPKWSPGCAFDGALCTTYGLPGQLPTITRAVYRVLPVPCIDLRYGRVSILDLGSSDDWGATRTKHLQSVILRGGSEDMVEASGAFGYTAYPNLGSISNTGELSSWLSDVAKQVLPERSEDIDVDFGSLNIVSLDLSSDRAVQCVWGDHETGGGVSYINHLEGADIAAMLSIDGEANPRIVLPDDERRIGVLKQGS